MRKNYIKKESEELKMELTITNAEITSLEETEKNEIDKEIDRIINQHKNNRYEVNRLVFESVAALTQSENYSNELNSQGILKRFWGGITGKNRKSFSQFHTYPCNVDGSRKVVYVAATVVRAVQPLPVSV